MSIWECDNYEEYLKSIPHRSGIRLRFEKGVDSEVRRAIMEFVDWIRSIYVFPLRVPIYIKKSSRIKSLDGELVYGTFFRPTEYGVEPYIRVSSCDYKQVVSGSKKDNELATILYCIAHELTHYFQYINKAKISFKGEEIQAGRCASMIIDRYSENRDHP
ncbi:MAG: hypothetical protein IJK34_04530 [Clostridia bacterium]|nr:hypothetical protein [Clostridia bacterium]